MSSLVSIPRRVYAYYIDPSPISGRVALLFAIFIIIELALVVYLLRQSEPWWFDAHGWLFAFRYVSAATTALLAVADAVLIVRRWLLPCYRTYTLRQASSRARS